jgi:two-component system sensor histidine kinase KdpD
MENSNQLERPDADALLAAINTQRKRRKGGKLHLYLGMAPGVGKTYAMLMAAREAAAEGQNVVIGIVESHGRSETQALMNGLEEIPRQKLEYRGITFEEMDLDAILTRKPKIALVDELAHTNVPGSRHAKRWQDVYELLDAGIDVYSTLNVQHLESRKESVEQIAQISVRETVPDSVLDRAYQIRLIDLSPTELLKRLKEGKVYLGEKAELASKNFFQEEKLTALREIALRLAAEKVDTDLQTFTASREAGAPWQAVERLMVAVDHRQQTQDLIRSTRRLAFNLEGPWLAVHVDTGRLLSKKDQLQLISNLEFARSLGADVITVSDTRVADALIRVARQKNVTQIVLGKSKRHWFQNTLHELVYEQDEIDVLVQGNHAIEKSSNIFLQSLIEKQALLSEYVRNAGIILTLSFPAAFFRSDWIYLMGMAVLCLASSLGPLLFGAGLASLMAYYLQFEHALSNSLGCLALALVGGILNSRIKLNRDLLGQREERSSVLYEVIRDILAISNREEMIHAVEARVGSFLKGECGVCLKRRDNSLKPQLPDSELGVAKWVLENQKPAGWSTDTISGAKALYLPLKGHSETLGVLIFRPGEQSLLAESDRNMLLTISKQLALSLEKELFRERAVETERLQEVSQVHRSILSFMADELRSPLSVIVQSVGIMLDKDETILENRRDEMANHLLNATEKLGLVIDNLLTISRLSVGIFPIKRENCSPLKLVQLAQEHLRRTLAEHPIEIKAASNLPDVYVDTALCEQAIANILANAANYAPSSMPIQVEIKHMASEIHISITDGGPGIPEAYLNRVFDKFYRYPGSRGQGAGIGLAVAKGVIRAHEGKITVANLPVKGACFTVILPVSPGR